MDILNQICTWITVGILAVAGGRRLTDRYPALRRLIPARGKQRNGDAQERGQGEGRQSVPDIPKRKLLLAVLSVFYGLVLIRSIGFGSIPGGFNQDGAMGAVDALALADYGTDRFGTWLPAHFEAWGYGQMSVLLSYLTVPFIKIWGLNSVTARMPMLLASIAGAGALYGLARDIFGRREALVTLLCVAVAPWHFMQSRWALDCNMFPHMFVLGLFFLNKGLQKSRYLYVSMVFFALCMYSYGVAFYMVPVFLLVSCILLLSCRRVGWKQVFGAMAVYFGLAWPVYGTMLINFMGWETVSLPFVTMQYFPGTTRVSDIVFFCEQPFVQLLSNIRTLWRQVFLQKPDLIWNAIDDFGTLYQCSIPLVLAGAGITIYHAVKGEKSRRVSCRVLLVYWVTSILTGLFINNVNVNRINIIFYCHIIFAGIAVSAVLKEWKRLGAGLAAVYGLLLILFLNRYFTEWADQMEVYFYADFIEAVEYAGDLEADYYYITPDSQFDGSWWTSQILTMYAMKMDAEYFQGKTDVFRGEEISYAYRYHFNNADGEMIRDDLNIVYVIRKDRLDDYDAGRFARKQFGNYYVVVPWRYAR